MRLNGLDKMGIDLRLSGDHRIHNISLSDQDIPITWDDVSLVLTIHLSEWDARELYFNLLPILLQLKDDRG